MTPEQARWIAGYADRCGAGLLGRCRHAVEEMRAAFPDLREVRGHVFDPLWGKRGHVWCVNAAGEIVDPTAAQFPMPQMLVYVPWKPGDTVLAGKCHECGEEIWVAVDSLEQAPPHRDFCDEACHGQFMRSL